MAGQLHFIETGTMWSIGEIRHATTHFLYQRTSNISVSPAECPRSWFYCIHIKTFSYFIFYIFTHKPRHPIIIMLMVQHHLPGPSKCIQQLLITCRSVWCISFYLVPGVCGYWSRAKNISSTRHGAWCQLYLRVTEKRLETLQPISFTADTIWYVFDIREFVCSLRCLGIWSTHR